jgi:hypothetical protein
VGQLLVSTSMDRRQVRRHHGTSLGHQLSSIEHVLHQPAWDSDNLQSGIQHVRRMLMTSAPPLRRIGFLDGELGAATSGKRKEHQEECARST